MRDSEEIDVALTARLANDAALTALLPDGVFFSVAPQGATRFVVCTLFDHEDTAVMGRPGERRGTEETVYEIRACHMDSSDDVARQAARRIDELLEDQPLAIVGYTCSAIGRERRIRETAVDAMDQSKRWQYRGGRYRVIAAPMPEVRQETTP